VTMGKQSGGRRALCHGWLRRQAGFSLLETMIASIILAILLMALMVVVMTTQKTFGSLATRSAVQMRVESAIDRMVRELRATGAGQVTTGSPGVFFVDAQTYDNVNFRPVVGVSGGTITWGAPITFRFEYDPVAGGGNEGDNLGIDDDGDGLVDEGRLVRTEGGSNTVLASGVTGVGFTMSGGQLAIQLTIVALDEVGAANPLDHAHSFTGVSSISFRNQ